MHDPSELAQGFQGTNYHSHQGDLTEKTPLARNSRKTTPIAPLYPRASPVSPVVEPWQAINALNFGPSAPD